MSCRLRDFSSQRCFVLACSKPHLQLIRDTEYIGITLFSLSDFKLVLD
jgi:hypothetical protein